jgi:hypothetical protein
MRALNRSVEETRTRLVTQIDRLEELKVQLEFNRAAVQISEAVKGGEASVDSIQTIVSDAQRLAADLDSFGKNSAAAAAAKPAEPAKPAVVDPRRRR